MSMTKPDASQIKFGPGTVADLAAPSGASLMGFDATLNYAAGTIGAVIHNSLLDVRMFPWLAGTVPGADDTAAVQAAIDSVQAAGVDAIGISPGTPLRITGPLTYTGKLSIVGLAGGTDPTNHIRDYPVVVNCHEVSGYLFDMPDVIDGTGGLSITNVSFSGYNTDTLTLSTTWEGLVKCATTAKSSFYLRLHGCMVGGSNSPTAIIDADGAVFFLFDDSYFLNWPLGYGFKTGSTTTDVATTITFRKCYWNSLRQVYEILSNASEVTFSDCVMESCLVAGAALKTNVTFNNLYSENMGYDPSGGGLSTGITPRNFGLTFSPDITGGVKAVHTCCYGQMVFDGYTIRATVGGMYWFDGIGRSSATGAGGLIELREIYQASGTAPLFQPDTDATSSKGSFEYGATVGLSNSTYMRTADARALSIGRVSIPWNDGIVREVEVKNGLFTLPPLKINGLSAAPTIYPDSSGSVVGDVCFKSALSQAAGTELSWVCTTAGTAGAKWDTLSATPFSVSASVLNAATLTVPITLPGVGSIQTFSVTASGGTGMACCLAITLGHFGAGSAIATTTVGSGVTAAYTHGGSLVLTNSTGVTVSIYVRQTSVGRTHV